MNNIIKYGSISNIPLYNCSSLTAEAWSRNDGRAHHLSGILEFIYGAIVIFLYIPMVAVMTEKEQFKMSCFKIMTYLTIVDILAILVNSVITGVLSYQGAVYCSYPTLIYVSGSIGLGLWASSCLVAMLLVTNRLLDFTFKSAVNFVFDKNRTFLVLGLPTIYGLYFIIFTPPLLFSSKYLGWFFDLFIFQGESAEYYNYPHLANNIIVVAVTCFLYIMFCCALGAELKNVNTGSESYKRSKQIFIQSVLICGFNLAASLLYVYINFFEAPYSIMVVAHINWELGHGAPAFIYLVFNTTIRNGVVKKLRLNKPKVIPSVSNPPVAVN